MMLKCFIIAIFVSVCIASVEEQECIFDGVRVKVGEKYSVPEKCKQYTCIAGGYTGKICPVSRPNPKLDCVRIPVDYSKPYPQCCGRWKCEAKQQENIP